MSDLVKKTMRLVFIFVTIVVCVGAYLIANGSLAWFTTSKVARAEGLSFSVETVPSLVIAKTEEQIAVREYREVKVDFDGVAGNDMIAVTRDESVADTYLKFLKNHYAVDIHTGNVKPGFELEFDPVPAENNDRYFIDYVVYIASANKPFEVESLSAMIVPPDNIEECPPYFNAVSIDFYIGEVSLANYCGTTSVAGSTEGTYVELLTDGIIPQNTDDCIKVIMRCYFDGDLKGEGGNAYVNSYTVSSDGVNIGVKFFVEESQSTEEN